MDSVPQKRCTKCGEYFQPTTEYFRKRADIKCGLNPSCKSCENIVTRNKYNQDIEQSRIKNRQKQERNRDRVRQSSRDWNRKNREKMAQTMREWRKNNPDKAAAVKQGRRARNKQLPHDFTGAQRERAINYFNGCCPVCDRQFNDLFNNRTVAMDHFWIPESRGGGYTSSNIIPLCHGLDGCNNSKSDTSPHVWLGRRYGKKKATMIMTRIEGYFEWVKQCA